METNMYDGQSPPHYTQLTATTSVLEPSMVGREVTDVLMFALPVHIAVLDHSGRIVAVNEAWKRFSDGQSPSAISDTRVGVDFLSAWREARASYAEDKSQVEASIRAVLDGKRLEVSVEYQVDLPHSKQWFLLQVSSLPGNVRGALITHIDIAERKRTEEEWANALASERIRRAELEKGRRADEPVRTDAPALGARSPLMFRLHALEALTDAALSQLSLDALIGELLERTMTVMHVDNAAMLLLEPDGTTLTLRAARGPEEELIGEVKVPVGKGFAGSIAAGRNHVVVDDVSTSEVVTPLLRDKLRSLVGVPLLVEDRLVGVVHVGSTTTRHFTQEDVGLLLLVADRIGPAVEHARLYAAEQEARARAEDALSRATASERQASERAETLQTIVETIADGVAVVDRDGRITRTNRAFRELLALDSVPGDETRHADDQALLLQVRDATGIAVPSAQLAISKALRGEVVKGPGTDILVRTPDGRDLEITASAAPLRNPDGQIGGAVMVTRDISWRRRLEREREEALANEMALKETTQRLDEFLATAAHDLRAPLAVATTAIDLAASRVERLASAARASDSDLEQRTVSIRSCLEEASQSVDRLSRMVTMLFDTAQLRAGILDLHCSPCNLARVVSEQVAALRKANPRRTIRVKIPADVSDTINVDVDRISQVVTNYVTNAIKYSAEDRPVDVHVRFQPDLARVSVHDRGPGLPPGEQERIWQRFYRVRGIHVQGRQSIGLGLGLHICKTIIEQHGGQVGVESAQGAGSTFWFTLPRTGPHA